MTKQITIKKNNSQNERYAMKFLPFLLLLATILCHPLASTPVQASSMETTKGIKEIKDSLYQGLGSLVNSLAEDTDSQQVLTIYISGIDTRSDKLEKKSRSDVNIIAVINRNTKKVLLVSTPRDYFVPLSISNGAPDKLTHAGIYGVDVSVDTLEMLYDLDIDYYFRVNFNSLTKIVDALGGITVHSDCDFTPDHAPEYHFYEGDNELDGKAALAFARERYAFRDGDRQRGKNQMYVMEGVMKKLASLDSNISISDLLQSLSDAYDTDMPYTTMIGLIAAEYTHLGEYTIENFSVTGSDGNAKPYSMSSNAYVMYPDENSVNEAKEKIQEIKAQ